jgi:Cytochrome c oxidase caa3 assembly factor (Caa3_CtaG)
MRSRLSDLQRIGYLATVMVVNTGIAMALSFARTPLYHPYAQETNRPIPITAVADQQIAGGICGRQGCCLSRSRSDCSHYGGSGSPKADGAKSQPARTQLPKTQIRGPREQPPGHRLNALAAGLRPRFGRSLNNIELMFVGGGSRVRAQYRLLPHSVDNGICRVCESAGGEEDDGGASGLLLDSVDYLSEYRPRVCASSACS